MVTTKKYDLARKRKNMRAKVETKEEPIQTYKEVISIQTYKELIISLTKEEEFEILSGIKEVYLLEGDEKIASIHVLLNNGTQIYAKVKVE